MRKKGIFLFLVLVFSFPAQLKLANNANFNSTHPIPLKHPGINNQAKPISKTIISIDQREIDCLALNIYFEAGIESKTGKRAVAHVTINRVESDKFPNTICGVVKQARTDWRGKPLRHKCQFSWFCDGKPDKPWRGRRWLESQMMAREYVMNYYKNRKLRKDPTHGSLYYHADYVRPYWAKYMKKTTKIGKHIFYKLKT